MKRIMTAPKTPKSTLTTSTPTLPSLQLYDHLSLVVHEVGNSWEVINERKRHIPRGHNLRSTINELSKLGVKLLDIDDGKIPRTVIAQADYLEISITLNEKRVAEETFQKIEALQKALYQELSGLNISGSLKWSLQNEAGQEMLEYPCVRLLWNTVIFGDEFPGIPSYQDLGISVEAYIAGFGDVPGEFGKRLNDYLIRKGANHAESIRMRKHFLDEIAQPILELLSEFENAYPQAIAASNRFRYNFRFNVLGSVKRIVGDHQRLLLMDKAGQKEN